MRRSEAAFLMTLMVFSKSRVANCHRIRVEIARVHRRGGVLLAIVLVAEVVAVSLTLLVEMIGVSIVLLPEQ